MEGQLHTISLSPTEGNMWSASTRCRLDGRLNGMHSSYGRCCVGKKTCTEISRPYSRMKSRFYGRPSPIICTVLTEISWLFHIECGDEYLCSVLLRNKINLRRKTPVSLSVKINLVFRFLRRLLVWFDYLSCISCKSAGDNITHVSDLPVLKGLSSL